MWISHLKSAGTRNTEGETTGHVPGPLTAVCTFHLLVQQLRRGRGSDQQPAASRCPRAHRARERCGGFLVEEGVEGGGRIPGYRAVRQQGGQRLQTHASFVFSCRFSGVRCGRAARHRGWRWGPSKNHDVLSRHIRGERFCRG